MFNNFLLLVNESNVEQQNTLIKQLAALREQLQNQEHKIKNELQINKVMWDSFLSFGYNPALISYFQEVPI